MTDEQEESKDTCAEHAEHIADRWPSVFMHHSTMPQGETQEAGEVVQRTAMTLEQIIHLCAHAYAMVAEHAPVALQRTLAGPMFVAAGQAMWNLLEQLQVFMAAQSIEPLDLHAEQIRAVRALIDDPATEELLREGLRELAERLEKEPQGTPDWPDVISDLGM